MKTADFDYLLPPEQIAQTPVEPRDRSCLMVLSRTTGNIEHRHFYDLPEYLNEGDTLIFNDSRVIPARLFGFIKDSNRKVELLLLRRLSDNIWEALVKPGKKMKAGTTIHIADKTSSEITEYSAQITAIRENGTRLVCFSDESFIEKHGHTPLPPYIKTPLKQSERYQTVYSRIKGSAAAPTAGLHFTSGLLNELRKKNIELAFVTLHIGLDTFQPVKEEDPQNHIIHSEYGELGEETARKIKRTKERGKRVIAVGTSSVRIIEAASQSGTISPFNGDIRLFIMPGYQFRTTDSMITNFHLPRSTLIMLVSAFAGKDKIFNAYNTARESGYRFYSFGDAMLIL